jgi:Tol biopolymer transport system component
MHQHGRLSIMQGRPGRTTAALLCALATAIVAAPTASAYTPYADAQFKIATSSYTFGQAPVFMPDGQIVFGQNYQKGDGNQVYIANRDGSDLKCLTCEMPGPNGVPAVRPQGDWILFHSWLGHHITLGSPGYGGIGSELYTMRPDGTDVTKVYSDPTVSDGEGTDDYHAYWSPDGQRLVWAHFNGNIIDGGGQGRWDVRVANFVVKNGKPSLTNVRIVRPDNGHWYETQWWAPDGSGFLYTESSGSAINTELYYCRLEKTGPCQVTRLTDNPAWDEQALFTPDMKDVIFMSSRDHPGFYNTFSQIAQDLNLTSDYDNFLVLPIFEAGFEQPLAQEETDLYELNLQTGSVRRLTTDGNDGWITPEFTWNPQNNQLFWTENRLPPGLTVPLPLQLADQARNTVNYLLHPDTKDGLGNGGNLLGTALPVQQQTRSATFGGACAPPAKETLKAPGPHPRVFVDGRRVKARERHRRVQFARPPFEQTFTVTVKAKHKTVKWSYTGMGCYATRAQR